MASPQELRMTPQRQIILDELRKVKTHPSADEVYKMVRLRQPRISLGTVYRNLETMSECGIIRKLDVAGSQRRFDSDTDSHYHVRCTGCGRVDDVEVNHIDGLEEALHGASGYEITGHRLEFIGRCPECKSPETGADQVA